MHCSTFPRVCCSILLLSSSFGVPLSTCYFMAPRWRRRHQRSWNRLHNKQLDFFFFKRSRTRLWWGSSSSSSLSSSFFSMTFRLIVPLKFPYSFQAGTLPQPPPPPPDVVRFYAEREFFFYFLFLLFRWPNSSSSRKWTRRATSGVFPTWSKVRPLYCVRPSTNFLHLNIIIIALCVVVVARIYINWAVGLLLAKEKVTNISSCIPFVVL